MFRLLSKGGVFVATHPLDFSYKNKGNPLILTFEAMNARPISFLVFDSHV